MITMYKAINAPVNQTPGAEQSKVALQKQKTIHEQISTQYRTC